MALSTSFSFTCFMLFNGLMHNVLAAASCSAALGYAFMKVLGCALRLSSYVEVLEDNTSSLSKALSMLRAYCRRVNNIDSLMMEVCSYSLHDDAMPTTIQDELKRFFSSSFTFKQSRRNSNPFLESLNDLLHELELIDYKAIPSFLATIYEIVIDVKRLLKGVKEYLKVELLKLNVLQMASAMTLAFIVKTAFLLGGVTIPGLCSLPNANFLHLLLLALALLLISASLAPLAFLKRPTVGRIALLVTMFFVVTLFPI
ncbi:MAG: hypothetical protein DRJ68_05825 [Thermoprotei archaeon]|nr:MAG: hypothetical protein DRJ68_05825 [Thermoprotei archaeon]